MANILAEDRRPSGRKVLTLAGTNDGMPLFVVAPGAEGHPALIEALDIVADMKRTAYTVVRRSAKQKGRAQ